MNLFNNPFICPVYRPLCIQNNGGSGNPVMGV